MLLGLSCGSINPVNDPKPLNVNLTAIVKENRNHLALSGIPVRIYKEDNALYPPSWKYTGLIQYTDTSGCAKFENLCTVYETSEPDTADRYMAYAESTSGYSQGSIIVTPTSAEPNLVKEIYVIPK
jgi:hypothetical protein